MDFGDFAYTQLTSLVTAGSSGIGLAIATELVDRGVKTIVIVVRAAEELEQAALGIRQSSDGVDVRTISIDLAKHESSAEVQRQIKSCGWQVDLLFNDVGLVRKQALAMDVGNNISPLTVDLMIRTVVDLSIRFTTSMVEQG